MNDYQISDNLLCIQNILFNIHILPDLVVIESEFAYCKNWPTLSSAWQQDRLVI